LKGFGLTGNSTNPMDDKGRVTLPTIYRKCFPGTSLVAVKDVRQTSDMAEGIPILKIFAKNDYKAWIDENFDQVGGFDPTNELHQEIQDDAWEAQSDLKFDPNTYRITVALDAREHARLGSEVFFIGMDRYVEMWDPAQHAKFKAAHKPRKLTDLRKLAQPSAGQ